jgi:hypothetical protein
MKLRTKSIASLAIWCITLVLSTKNFAQQSQSVLDNLGRQRAKIDYKGPRPVISTVPIGSNSGQLLNEVRTSNGITYKVYYNTSSGATYRKGILVLGSGNNENSPSPGDMNGAAENALCQKAAENGYVAAIVQYTKGTGVSNWNGSAAQMGQDFDKCIVALSATFGIDKTKSVIGGVSYASFMLLTDIANNNTLSYAKGLLAACGSTGEWQAQNFKIPVYSIVCAGNYEGDFAGTALYDKITNAAIKALSEGVTDSSCNGHCAGNWTNRLYTKLSQWIP